MKISIHFMSFLTELIVTMFCPKARLSRVNIDFDLYDLSFK